MGNRKKQIFSNKFQLGGSNLYGDVGITSTGFIPTYSGAPLEMAVKASDNLQKSYYQNVSDMDKISLAVGQMATLAADDPIKQQAVAEAQGLIDNIAKGGGDYENAFEKIHALSRQVALDPNIKEAVTRKQQYDEWEKDLNTRLANGTLSKSGYNYAMDKAKSYAGINTEMPIGDQDAFNSYLYTPGKNVELGRELTEFTRQWAENSNVEILPGGRYRYKNTETYIDADEVRRGVMEYAKSDPTIANFVKDELMYQGITDPTEEDFENYLKGAADAQARRVGFRKTDIDESTDQYELEDYKAKYRAKEKATGPTITYNSNGFAIRPNHLATTFGDLDDNITNFTESLATHKSILQDPEASPNKKLHSQAQVDMLEASLQKALTTRTEALKEAGISSADYHKLFLDSPPPSDNAKLYAIPEEESTYFNEKEAQLFTPEEALEIRKDPVKFLEDNPTKKFNVGLNSVPILNPKQRYAQALIDWERDLSNEQADMHTKTQEALDKISEKHVEKYGVAHFSPTVDNVTKQTISESVSEFYDDNIQGWEITGPDSQVYLPEENPKQIEWVGVTKTPVPGRGYLFYGKVPLTDHELAIEKETGSNKQYKYVYGRPVNSYASEVYTNVALKGLGDNEGELRTNLTMYQDVSEALSQLEDPFVQKALKRSGTSGEVTLPSKHEAVTAAFKGEPATVQEIRDDEGYTVFRINTPTYGSIEVPTIEQAKNTYIKLMKDIINKNPG